MTIFMIIKLVNIYRLQSIFIDITTLILTKAMYVRKREHKHSIETGKQKHRVGQKAKLKHRP
jgi:hypothetical protein